MKKKNTRREIKRYFVLRKITNYPSNKIITMYVLNIPKERAKRNINKN